MLTIQMPTHFGKFFEIELCKEVFNSIDTLTNLVTSMNVSERSLSRVAQAQEGPIGRPELNFVLVCRPFTDIERPSSCR